MGNDAVRFVHDVLRPWWPARHSGFAQAEAIEMSFLMNNRGLIERVVLEVGLDLGVIPRSVFAMPVFIAVLSRPITGPSLEGIETNARRCAAGRGYGLMAHALRGPRDDAGAPPSIVGAWGIIVGTDPIDPLTDPSLPTLPIEGSNASNFQEEQHQGR